MRNEYPLLKHERQGAQRTFQALMLVMTLACSAQLRAAPGITPQTEQALLRGDWAAVAM